MFHILHKPTGKVHTVYAFDTDLKGECLWFLIYRLDRWDWLDAKECEPYVL